MMIQDARQRVSGAGVVINNQYGVLGFQRYFPLCREHAIGFSDVSMLAVTDRNSMHLSTY
jgi:hypothetical protein